MENELPRAKPGFMCPLLKKDMSEVCHTCGWWTGLYWKDETTKEMHNKWNCAIVTTALGQVDVVRASGGVHAATVDMRNEIVKRAASPPVWATQQIVRDELARAQMQMIARQNGQQELALGMAPQRLIES